METNTTNNNTRRHTPAHIYSYITVGVFVAMTIVLLFFPRSVYSELEKRDLDTVPEFTVDKLLDNSYTARVSHWFNDTEPFRDKLMALSMTLRHALRLNIGGDEAISFHATDVSGAAGGADVPDGAVPDDMMDGVDEGVQKVGAKGIIVLGTEPNARALMMYGGNGGGDALASAASRYAAEMPDVRVYEMVIPLATEFYLPEKALKASASQLKTIENIRSKISSKVTHVDAYSALKAHTDEDIYLRTDHHWAPLGAYYAAEQLAKAAGVPFKPLSAYDRRVVHRFVGTMYGYSQDMAVKNSPEDFVYYVPTGVDYNTTYRTYTLNKEYQVTGESKPVQGVFFQKFPDGSGGAYSTFMGGDTRLTVVKTGTKNGRRLLIIKDSYGNAVPGYMFYSFEEVHVVDFRYFTHNIKNYCRNNKITDLAFVFNIFNAYSPSSAEKAVKFLTQGEGQYAPKTVEEPAKPAEKQPEEKPAEPAKQPAEAEPVTTPASPDRGKPVTTPEPTTTPEPATTPNPLPAPAPAPGPKPEPKPGTVPPPPAKPDPTPAPVPPPPSRD